MGPVDARGRRMAALRISVTDRCDLVCRYCRPAGPPPPAPAREILSFEEIARLAGVFASLGIARFKLTGGEPLQRRDLPDLVRMLTAVPGLRELSLTTNGTRLAEFAAPLKGAGLDRLTVSLDALAPDRYAAITGADALGRVLAGVVAAQRAGFPDLRLNTVVLRGLNDWEVPSLLAFARRIGATLRLIEFMPIGVPREEWERRFVPAAEMIARLRPWLADPEATLPGGAGPARYLEVRGGGRVGVIAGVSRPFCEWCDRLRLTARGALRLCLASPLEADLRATLRAGGSDDALRAAIIRAVPLKPAGGTYAEAPPAMCAVGG